MTRVPCAAGLILALLSCQGKGDADTKPPRPTDSVAPTAPAAPASDTERPLAPATASPAVSIVAPDLRRYPWLAGDRDHLPATSTLEARFPAPPGYSRVNAEPGSFADWLRTLPIAAEGTPVKAFDGRETLRGDDDYLAGVVAIDVGSSDLQQSSDVIVRLHAEYLWSGGAKEKISYLSATKLNMPLARWEKGQRLIANGASVFWAIKGKPAEADYAEFRRYLDAVFNWSNSSSLGPRSTRVGDPKELTAGDFFLQSKPPHHVVVVLDVAEKPSGELVALLGQARNPAENIHVVRPGKATAWFSVRPPVPIMSPHSKTLAWSDLRRLAAGASE